MVRLGHPFPSLLNALATGTIATIAGAPPSVALRLAASMLALQVSIGALNDVRDVDVDRGRKPGKPIPRGLVPVRGGMALTVIAAMLGLGLSAASGGPTLLAAAAGLACGYAYDIALNRSLLSWLPLAVALPLVPIHAWLGATGTTPHALVALVPVAILAGAALAVANGIVDEERDRAAARPTVVVRLGQGRAWLVHLALVVAVGLLVVTVAPREVTNAIGPGIDLRTVGLAGGLLLLGLGAAGLRHPSTSLRERAWELEAVGVAAIGIGWLAATAGAR